MVRRSHQLFVEGGGQGDASRSECRKAFSKLLEKAGFARRMPRIVACGSRRTAYERFRTAHDGGSVLAVLLVDSEGPVVGMNPWQHVAQREGDGWTQPEGAREEQLHFMVECMEAWLLADSTALQTYYGHDFKAAALGSATDKPEDASKRDLMRRLEQATRGARTKGSYSKGRHSFQLVARLDPRKVRQACPWADRFFSTLERLL